MATAKRKKAEPQLLSQRAYARHRQERGLVGDSLSAVQRALSSGRIQLEERDGKVGIDPAAADKSWAELTKPSPAPRRGRRKGEPPPEDPAGNGGAGGYIGARGEHESLKVELTRLELAKKRGELIDAGAMEQELGALARDIRRQLLLIPARIASSVRAAPDDRAVEAMLDTEIRQVLLKLTEAAGDGSDR